MNRPSFAAVALVAISALLALSSSRPQLAHTSPGDEIRVVGPVVARVGDEFSVDIDISEADVGYAGYQAWLAWDSTILDYVDPPGVTHTGLGGMILQPTPDVLVNGVRFGAARMSGCANDTGTAARVSLQCIGTGTSVLHLVSLPEDPAYGTTFLGCGEPHGSLTDDSVACLSDADADGDGCSEYQEAFGTPPPYPGSTCAAPGTCYSDASWYDFFDVPVPANSDPTPNGARDQAVTMGDAMAVLTYVGTFQGGGANPNGVAYDSDKGVDTDGDTIADVPPDGVADGRDYDRSPGAESNPPWEAGPPDGSIPMSDVLAVLAQVGLACTEAA